MLLIVSGGIAAYKALELIRLLRGRDCAVTCVLTAAGAHFVTPLSLQALSEGKVYTDLFSLTDESEMGHIQLSRSADLVVVAPASADILAKMAAGLADDLASTLLLATDKPVLVAPAMNVRMWQHAATVANMALLAARGVHVVGPDEGAMACNEFGPGRLAEPPAILAAIEALLAPATPAVGPPRAGHQRADARADRSGALHRQSLERAAGACDRRGACRSGRARHAGQRSGERSRPARRDDAPRGKRAARCWTRARRRCRPTSRCSPRRSRTGGLPARPAGKIKKVPGAAPPALELVPNPDILATIAAAGPRRPRLVVGFAAETDDLMANAQAKRERKNADWIVANDVSPATGIMGGEENAVHLITADGVEDWPRLAKSEVARRLAARVAAALA